MTCLPGTGRASGRPWGLSEAEVLPPSITITILIIVTKVNNCMYAMYYVLCLIIIIIIIINLINIIIIIIVIIVNLAGTGARDNAGGSRREPGAA